MNKKEKNIIGWREWLELPELKIKNIKAKIDSGARSSSLHAFDIVKYKKAGQEFIKFKVHPIQRSTKTTVTCQTKLLEYRKVKSSNGQSELRPVIVTPVRLMGQEWPIEITLTSRDEMSFRMLLGRESFKNKFYIDAANSYFGKKKKTKSIKKGKKK